MGSYPHAAFGQPPTPWPYTIAMEKRLQKLNGDTVLEITTQEAVKVRLSENDLTRRKAYLEKAITNFQSELDDTNAQLASIYAEVKG